MTDQRRRGAEDVCLAFLCPCGHGCGVLQSAVVHFAGQPLVDVSRTGSVARLHTAAQDGVYLEVRCPADHVFFVAITMANEDPQEGTCDGTSFALSN
jgi:hypothetical protein